jgi:hypothetical protein
MLQPLVYTFPTFLHGTFPLWVTVLYYCILYFGVYVCYITTLSGSRLYTVDDRMINEYGAVGGMRIGGGNSSPRRKHASFSFCPPKIPHELTWDRTVPAADFGISVKLCLVRASKNTGILTFNYGTFIAIFSDICFLQNILVRPCGKANYP